MIGLKPKMRKMLKLKFRKFNGENMSEVLKKNNIKDWYLENFTIFENKLNGQSSSVLHKMRKNSLQLLKDLDFPNTKTEEWKYTDITPVLKNNFVPAVNSELPLFKKDDIAKYLFEDFEYHLLVFINGIFSEELSDIGTIPKNVFF